jgi:hypothetical protein
MSAIPVLIKPNNWSSFITESIGKAIVSVKNFTIGLDGGGVVSPAPGCTRPLLFTAKYSCGADPTENSMNKTNAWGNVAKLDCSKTFQKCNSLKLTLDDRGVLTLTDKDGNQLWQSDLPTTDATNPPIALPQYAATSNTPAPNRHSQKSYLSSGEFLKLGEWIGSPAGTFRLEMVEADGQKTLRVAYNAVGCTDAREITNNVAPIDKNSASIYSIPSIYPQNVGRTGYINEFGQLQPYPGDKSMNKYGANFESVGKYGVVGSDIGTNKKVAGSEECLTECRADPNCAAVIFDQVASQCQLKSSTALSSGQRYINNNYEYYVRTLDVSPDISCPQTIETSDAATWEGMPAGAIMSSTTYCGLKKFTQAERDANEAAFEAVDKNASGSVGGVIDYLSGKYKTLTDYLSPVKSNQQKAFDELEASKKGLDDWSGETLAQLDAMNEDSELNMKNQYLKHNTYLYLFIGLAILLVLLPVFKLAWSFISKSSKSGAAPATAPAAAPAAAAAPAPAAAPA